MTELGHSPVLLTTNPEPPQLLAALPALPHILVLQEGEAKSHKGNPGIFRAPAVLDTSRVIQHSHQLSEVCVFVPTFWVKRYAALPWPHSSSVAGLVSNRSVCRALPHGHISLPQSCGWTVLSPLSHCFQKGHRHFEDCIPWPLDPYIPGRGAAP